MSFGIFINILLLFMCMKINENQFSEERIKYIMDKYKDLFEALENYDKTGELHLKMKSKFAK
jgi:hypothetical protein